MFVYLTSLDRLESLGPTAAHISSRSCPSRRSLGGLRADQTGGSGLRSGLLSRTRTMCSARADTTWGGWCRERDLNPQGPLSPLGPQPSASASSAIPARGKAGATVAVAPRLSRRASEWSPGALRILTAARGESASELSQIRLRRLTGEEPNHGDAEERRRGRRGASSLRLGAVGWGRGLGPWVGAVGWGPWVR